MILLPSISARAETTIQQAFIQAYKTNPGLQAEQAKVRAIDEKVSQALSGYRPRVDALADAGKRNQNIKNDGIETDKKLTPKSVSLQVVQPIFRGFRTQASVQAAEMEVQAARAELTDYEQRLFFETGKTFLDIVREVSVLDLLSSHEAILEQQLDQAQDRLDAGISTQTDVLQAQARLEKIHADRIQTEGSLAANRVAYERLTGAKPDNSPRAPKLSLDKSLSLQEIIARAETKNPRVIAAHYSRENARSGIDQAQGNLLPEIDLVGSTSRAWEQSSLVTGREDSSQIMLQLRVPLYHGGADYAKTRAASQTALQRGLELENRRRLAHEQAVRGWQLFATAQATIAARETAIRAAQMALDGVLEEQTAGTRTTIDVLNAQQELLDARVGLVSAEHDKDIAVLQIKEAIGGLTIQGMDLAVNVYDPTQHYEETKGQWIGLP